MRNVKTKLMSLALAALPGTIITDKGLVDGEKLKFVELFR